MSVDGGADWDCPVPPATPGTVICTFTPNGGDLVPGTTDQITVVIAVPADRTSAVTNTAHVESSVTPDPTPGNNTDSVTTTPTASSDLAITKVSTTDIVAGSPGSYRFSISNLGPSDAQPDVTVTDTLPTGLTFSGWTDVTGTWDCDATGQVVTCTLAGVLAEGDSAVVDLEVDVASNVLGTITNTATVGSPTPDPVPGNNSSTDSSGSSTEADLFITKTDAPDPVRAGESITYTLEVGNEGPSDALGPIVVTDEVPPGTTYVSATGGATWSCAQAAGTITCTRSQTLVAGDDGSSTPITIVVDVDPSAGPGTIVNTATVESLTTPEPSGGEDNNSATAETTVIDETELSITKTTTGDDEIVAGDPAGTEFTVTVTNNGPSTADNVTVVDTLEAGLVPVSASGAGWTCAPPSGQTITCARASLALGSSVILVQARAHPSVADGTTLTNSATVSTSTPGDGPGNNTATSDVDVIAEADLAVTKSHDPGTYLAGDTVTFDLAVTNNGFSDAQPVVTAEDTLPDGLVFAGSTGVWSCLPGPVTPSGQVVTCTLPPAFVLPADTDAPALSITARIDATADDGDYTNDVEVSSPTTDPDPSNNADDDTVTVGTEADLAITKTHATPVRIGDDTTFTLTVFNNGPSEARDVEVVDTLPTGLTYVAASVDSPTGTCAAVGQVVTCTLADPLPPDATATISVVATVEVSAYPSVDNPAEVSTSTQDPDASNDEAVDTVVVPAQVDLSVTKSHTADAVVGGTLAYTIVVGNAGPTPDPGPVTLVDELPVGLTFVSGTAPGWTCSDAGQTVTCVNAAGLAVGEEQTLTLVAAVGPEAAPGVDNVVSVGSGAEDLDPTNNQFVDPTVVIPLAQLRLQKDVAAQTKTTATYTLTVTNEGPNATTTPPVLTDPLPTGLSFISAEGDDWVCGFVDPTVTCTYGGVLGVGEATTVSLVTGISAEPGSTIENVATVTGGSPTAVASVDDAILTLPSAEDLPGTGAVHLLEQLVIGVGLVLVGAMVLLLTVATGRRRT